MALRRNLLQRILANPKFTPPPPPPASFRPRNNTSTSTISPPSRLPFPIGDDLIDKLRGHDTVERVRRRLDGFVLPSPVSTDTNNNNNNNKITNDEIVVQLSVDDARKFLHLTKLESVKATLRGLQQTAISYSDFLNICSGSSSASSPHNDGLHIAKSLDESGAVIVLGNLVFLRPEEVAREISTLIPRPGAGRIIHREKEEEEEEMREMEKRECVIEKTATEKVRRELWLGLGFVAVQTVGFMRLTFWELTWDVMEPICFYVTSFYFMAGYYFFMTTSKDPSFQEIFKTRVDAKKRRLMEADNFDVERFRQLRRDFNPRS